MNGGQGKSRFEDDESASTQAKDGVRARFRKNGIQVFNILLNAVLLVIIVGTQATSAAIGHVDSERICERFGELGEVLGYLHAALHEHEARTMAVLAIADGGAVGRGDGAGCRVFPRGCGRLGVDAGCRVHVLILFLAS